MRTGKLTNQMNDKNCSPLLIELQRGYLLHILIIQNFLGNIDRTVFALFEGSANVFSNDTNAEKLHAAKEQNQNNGYNN